MTERIDTGSAPAGYRADCRQAHGGYVADPRVAMRSKWTVQEISASPAAGAASARAVAAVPEEANAAAADDTAAIEAPRVDAAQMASATGAADDPRRRFVRTASARFGVADVYGAAMAIEDAAAAQGGFVVENRIGTEVRAMHERRLGDGRLLQLSEIATHGNLVVRVPSERSQAFLRGIVKHMAFLDTREFAANDVQFDLLRRDLAARRAALVQAELVRAGRQVGRTEARIDAAMARGDVLAARDEAMVAQRELEDQVAFSTVRLELHQPAQLRRVEVPDVRELVRRSGPGFFAGLGEAIADGWRALLDTVVQAVRLWPLWLVLAGAVFAARALVRRRAARPVARTPT